MMNPQPALVIIGATILFCAVWALRYGFTDWITNATTDTDELTDEELYDAHHADAVHRRSEQQRRHNIAVAHIDQQPVDLLPADAHSDIDDLADLLEFERTGDWVGLYRDTYNRVRLENRDAEADREDLTPLRNHQ